MTDEPEPPEPPWPLGMDDERVEHVETYLDRAVDVGNEMGPEHIARLLLEVVEALRCIDAHLEAIARFLGSPRRKDTP